jgi:Domain of unknown function (DUF4304)
MSEKPDTTAKANEMQRWLRPQLKKHGFVQSGRSYNRLNESGLTDVINIQLGFSNPDIPWKVARLDNDISNKYFTVNLGVFVPEVHRLWHGYPLRKTISEADCCIRSRLGSVGREYEDVWRALQRNDALYKEVFDDLIRIALPYFKKFSTREEILRETSEYLGYSPTRIVQALILYEQGQTGKAAQLLSEQVENSADHRGHQEHVRELALRLNISLSKH